MTKRKLLSGKSWRGVLLGAFLVFPRRHHCSIFATHWAMTLFSNVYYTSTLTVVTGTPFLKLAVQTHLTPSYRLFSILDAAPIYRFGAPSLRGIGRHPSMPSAWIGFMRSNLLTSTANSFTDVTVKSNRTGNIPRRLRGIGVTSLYAFDQSRFGVLHFVCYNSKHTMQL